MKSERLKKLENELQDLQKWLNLGLVPKKDIEKHKEEILSIEEKLSEEKERLRFLKENGDLEEYVTPKRSQPRAAYPDTHTLPDMDFENNTDAGLDMETTTYDTETSFSDAISGEDTDKTITEDDEDDPFSDRNRWKRGVLEDPDVDNW